MYLRDTGRAYNCAVQLNGTAIMTLMVEVANKHGSHPQLAPLCASLLATLLNFAIYNRLLRPLKRSIWLSVPSLNPAQEGNVIRGTIAWLAKRVHVWTEIQEAQHKYALSCANPQVRCPIHIAIDRGVLNTFAATVLGDRHRQ